MPERVTTATSAINEFPEQGNVAKVADVAVASAGNLKNWRAVAGRSVSGTEGFAPSKSRK